MHRTDRQRVRAHRWLPRILLRALVPVITTDEFEIQKQLAEIALLVQTRQRYGDAVAARLAMRAARATASARLAAAATILTSAALASRAVRQPRRREIRGTRRSRAPGGSEPDPGDRPAPAP